MICSAMRVISTIDRNTSPAIAVIARMMKTTLFVLLHTCFRAWLASRLYRVAIRRPTVIPPYEGGVDAEDFRGLRARRDLGSTRRMSSNTGSTRLRVARHEGPRQGTGRAVIP